MNDTPNREATRADLTSLGRRRAAALARLERVNEEIRRALPEATQHLGVEPAARALGMPRQTITTWLKTIRISR